MKSISTESSVVVEQDEERRENRFFRRLIDLWPIGVVLLGGVAACFKFYYNVADLAESQKTFKATVDQRRDKNHDDMEAIRNRLTKNEIDIEWLKK